MKKITIINEDGAAGMELGKQYLATEANAVILVEKGIAEYCDNDSEVKDQIPQKRGPKPKH